MAQLSGPVPACLPNMQFGFSLSLFDREPQPYGEPRTQYEIFDEKADAVYNDARNTSSAGGHSLPLKARDDMWSALKRVSGIKLHVTKGRLSTPLLEYAFTHLSK